MRSNFLHNPSSKILDFFWEFWDNHCMFYFCGSVTAINGFVYRNVPGLTMCKGNKVTWHLSGLGSESDINSLYFQGNRFIYRQTRRDSISVFPHISHTVTMEPDSIGMRRCVSNTHFLFFFILKGNLSDKCVCLTQNISKYKEPREQSLEKLQISGTHIFPLLYLIFTLLSLYITIYSNYINVQNEELALKKTLLDRWIRRRSINNITVAISLSYSLSVHLAFASEYRYYLSCFWRMSKVSSRPSICMVSAHIIFVSFRSVWSGVTNSKKLPWWDESQLHSRKVWLLSESDWIHDAFKNILHCCHGNRLGLLSKPHLGDWDVPWSGEVQHCQYICVINVHSATCACTAPPAYV